MGHVLAIGEPIAVSHGCAARLWGFEQLGHGWVDLTMPPGRYTSRREPVTLHRSPLPAGEVTRRQGMPVTAPVRTLADLVVQYWDTAVLRRFVDQMIRDRILGLRDLTVGVDRMTSHPGRTALLRMLDGHLEGGRFDGSTPGSAGELWVQRIAVAAGLPALVAQHCVDLGDRLLWVDLAIPELRIAVEFDGWSIHAGRSNFDADRRRWDDLTAAGWRVVVITSAMSEKEVIRRITRAVADRRAAA